MALLGHHRRTKKYTNHKLSTGHKSDSCRPFDKLSIAKRSKTPAKSALANGAGIRRITQLKPLNKESAIPSTAANKKAPSAAEKSPLPLVISIAAPGVDQAKSSGVLCLNDSHKESKPWPALKAAKATAAWLVVAPTACKACHTMATELA